MMPFLTVLFVVWQQIYARGDNMALAVAVLSALFALCLPLQGFYWLGKRAQMPLSPQSAVGFQRVFEKLRETHDTLPSFPRQAHLFGFGKVTESCSEKITP